MDPIPLTEELFRNVIRRLSILVRSSPLSFLAVGQIGFRHIPVFVARTPYAQLPAMPAYMPVEPFEAFPKEFHVRRKTHVALACGIGHADVKVIKIRFPV